MKKVIFVIAFISLIFFGYQYLTEKLLVPNDETNMDEKEKQAYLESFGTIDDNSLNETIILSFKQCMEMSYAYNTYSCVSGMIGNDTTELVGVDSTKTNDSDETGKNLYNAITNNKAIIEMNISFNKTESNIDKGLYVYEGTFSILQESEKPVYIITVQEGEIIRFQKKEG